MKRNLLFREAIFKKKKKKHHRFYICHDTTKGSLHQKNWATSINIHYGHDDSSRIDDNPDRIPE